MRLKLLAGSIFLVVAAYSIFWFTLVGNLESRIASWVSEKQAEGYKITYTSLELYGFPYRMEMTLKGLEMTLPASSDRPFPLHLGATKLMAVAFPWKLDHAVIQSDALTLVGGTVNNPEMEIAFLKARSSLNLQEDFSTVDRFSIVADQTRIHYGDMAGEWHADVVKFHYLKPDENASDTELDLPAWGQFYVETQKLSVPRAARELIGDSVENMRLDLVVHAKTWPRLTRRSLSAWRDQGGTLSIRKLALKAEVMDFEAQGDLALDQDLKWLGAFSVTLNKDGRLLGRLPVSKGQELAISFQNGWAFIGQQPAFELQSVVE